MSDRREAGLPARLNAMGRALPEAPERALLEEPAPGRQDFAQLFFAAIGEISSRRSPALAPTETLKLEHSRNINPSCKEQNMFRGMLAALYGFGTTGGIERVRVAVFSPAAQFC